jgi:hypothetical protein
MKFDMERLMIWNVSQLGAAENFLAADRHPSSPTNVFPRGARQGYSDKVHAGVALETACVSC